MRIKEFQIYTAQIPLNRPFVTSLGPEPYSEHIFVRVVLDNDVFGWGECAPSNTINGEILETCLALVPKLTQALIGIEVCEHQTIERLMNQVIYANFSIKSAIDLACYDAAAKSKDLPLYRYLGALKLKPMQTDYTVSLNSPELMAQQAIELKAQGFTLIKVKLGENAEMDVQRIKAIREAIGPEIKLKLDANQGWTFEEAVMVLNELNQCTIEYCEEPINRKLAYRLGALQRAVPIPIMADESVVDHHDAENLVTNQNIGLFNLKIGKSGGITPILNIIDVAQKHDVKMQVGGFIETKIVFTANCHLAQCSDNIVFFDCDSPLFHQFMPTHGGMIYEENWFIRLTEQPGLGIDLQPEFLAQCKRIQ
jgi:L-alanine-DL-glutamate epimerase-like enolase superfamily enzyme